MTFVPTRFPEDPKNGRRKILASLRVSQGIQRLPGDDHRHQRRLAGAGGHLAAQSFPRSAIACQENALPKFGGALHPPDQRLDGLQLAEVEGQLAGAAIQPVFQQAARDGGHARITGRTPSNDAPANFIDLPKAFRATGVVAHIEDFIARRPAFLAQAQSAISRLLPMAGRRVVGRVDDQGLHD